MGRLTVFFGLRPEASASAASTRRGVFLRPAFTGTNCIPPQSATVKTGRQGENRTTNGRHSCDSLLVPFPTTPTAAASAFEIVRKRYPFVEAAIGRPAKIERIPGAYPLRGISAASRLLYCAPLYGVAAATPCCLLPAPCCLLPAPYSLLPTPCSLLPSPPQNSLYSLSHMVV